MRVLRRWLRLNRHQAQLGTSRLTLQERLKTKMTADGRMFWSWRWRRLQKSSRRGKIVYSYWYVTLFFTFHHFHTSFILTLPFIITCTPLKTYISLYNESPLYIYTPFHVPQPYRLGDIYIWPVCEWVCDNFEPWYWSTRFMRVISLSLSSDKPVLQQSVCM